MVKDTCHQTGRVQIYQALALGNSQTRHLLQTIQQAWSTKYNTNAKYLSIRTRERKNHLKRSYGLKVMGF